MIELSIYKRKHIIQAICAKEVLLFCLSDFVEVLFYIAISLQRNKIGGDIKFF